MNPTNPFDFYQPGGRGHPHNINGCLAIFFVRSVHPRRSSYSLSASLRMTHGRAEKNHSYTTPICL